MIGYRSCRACGHEANCADLVGGLCPVCARERVAYLADLQVRYQAAVDAGGGWSLQQGGGDHPGLSALGACPAQGRPCRLPSELRKGASAIPAYKDKQRGTWYASFYFTDWQGHRKKKIKRGFARQKDAKAFEEEFLKQGSRTCDMSFASLVELYLPDMEHRLKPTTMQTKRNIIENRVLPFFKDLAVNQITPAHVRRWQSELLASGLSPTYVKTINNQLAAIFNYATKYYGLAVSPARLAGSVGKKQAQEMHFWTVEEFKTFIPNVPKLPARTGLSILFWTGLRISELLSLRADDIDLEARTLTVDKGYQVVGGKELIMDTKTPRSRRIIPLPEVLCDEIRTYLDALYEPQPDDRLFPYTKSYFHRQMQTGCDAAGMEKIRLHDLRHSHAALLIRLGTPILLVSERLGHENVETTLKTYGHLYPTAGSEAVQKLDDLMR